MGRIGPRGLTLTELMARGQAAQQLRRPTEDEFLPPMDPEPESTPPEGMEPNPLAPVGQAQAPPTQQSVDPIEAGVGAIDGMVDRMRLSVDQQRDIRSHLNAIREIAGHAGTGQPSVADGAPVESETMLGPEDAPMSADQEIE